MHQINKINVEMLKLPKSFYLKKHLHNYIWGKGSKYGLVLGNEALCTNCSSGDKFCYTLHNRYVNM